MNQLTHTYDPETGKELLTIPYEAPRSVTKGIMSARIALQAIKARVRETNRRQDFVRWIVGRTAIAGTWNPGTLYPVLFDTETYGTEEYKGRSVDCVPTVSWKYICGEPGIRTIQGVVTQYISYPAVPATMIQRVTVYVRHRSYLTGAITYFEQQEAIASVGIAAGATVAHYLRGWSIVIGDDIVCEAGDELEAYWQFQGFGAITFIDEYKAFIAIQKTGEKYIDGSCCDE